MGPTAGKLADSLDEAGVKPEQIGKVVLTHAHPDHIWGLIDELDNSLRYPRAQEDWLHVTAWMDVTEIEDFETRHGGDAPRAAGGGVDRR